MRSLLSRFATTIIAGLLVVAACAPATTPVPLTPPASGTAPTSSEQAVSPAFRAIAAGLFHTCAITSGGGVECWGNHDSGVSSEPAAVPGLASGVSAIAARHEHTCAITGRGGVKCWGNNSYGQLGNGPTINELIPVPVDVSGLASGVRAITTGATHTCAIAGGGGVKCWGNNSDGQLGNGATTDSVVPVDVTGVSSGTDAIAAGGNHTCAVTSAGGVKCWGANSDGQLGNGATTDSFIPVDVTALSSGISAIAAGYEHTCAITAAGGVKCWGANSDGQLGNGATTDSLVPVDVSGLASGVSAISAGTNQTCAIARAGGLKCWGDNADGQLGNGATTDSLVPVDVSGLTRGVSSIAAGDRHTCAVIADSGVACWGDNSLSQLGSVVPCVMSSIPVVVGSATPSSSSEPTVVPDATMEHATGATDVVLRFDMRPDLNLPGQLNVAAFQPGPEFTLYGDGTVIFRNERAEVPPVEGPIVRAGAFRIARLDEEQIQTLLRFAVGEGGLRDACQRYEGPASDDITSSAFIISVGGLDKRVDIRGADNPLEVLADHLRNVDTETGITSQVWVPDRYWGNLLDADYVIEFNLLPAPREAGIIAWPWPGIAPRDFVIPTEPGWGPPRRAMSKAEAAVKGLSNNGGVVSWVYLLGPDGKTVHIFSLWPMLPDETG